MQYKKVFKQNKNSYFSLQSKKSRQVHFTTLIVGYANKNLFIESLVYCQKNKGLEMLGVL